MKKFIKILFLVSIASIILPLIDKYPTALPVFAQDSTWTPQQRIPGYDDGTSPPVLIADRNGTVHAFSYQQARSSAQEIAIIYNTWTLGQGWSLPNDILLSPLKHAARLLGVFLDDKGFFHLIFFGGDNTGANIYYSRAPATSADKASAWSTPVQIGDNALNPQNGAIFGDDQGNLAVLYSGYDDGNGLYAVFSDNGGDTWSDPAPIFLTGDNQLWPYESRMYLGTSGQLYTVWSVYDIAGHGQAVYFARLKIGQRQWSDPYILAKNTNSASLGVDLPSLIERDSTIYITFYDGVSNTHWMRSSTDMGQSWTNPIRIAPRHIGRNNAVSLVLDSNNVMHFLFGERIPGNPDIHGMWHSIWLGDHWSEPEAVVSGPRVVDLNGYNSFDPNTARAVISMGNILLVTWRTDPGATPTLPGNGVWYSFKILDSPELPAIPLPVSITPTSSTSVTAENTVVISATSSPNNSSYENQNFQSNIYVNNPGSALFISVIFSVFFIIVLISLYKLNHS
jgi:hypothetical protein